MNDIDRFDRDGFVIVDGVFAQQEMQEFSTAFVALVDALNGRQIGEIYDACAHLPEFLRLVGRWSTVAVVNSLLGNPHGSPLYTFTPRVRIDPPLDDRRTYGWHQEEFYSIPGSRFIQTWAPLINDTTPENGTIQVCVGSHKEGVAEQSWADIDGRATQIIVAPEVVNKYEQRAIPMEVGQMMFFNSRLFHRSGKNTSNEVRLSMVGQYHDVNSPGFNAPKPKHEWRGETPREYYDRWRRGA